MRRRTWVALASAAFIAAAGAAATFPAYAGEDEIRGAGAPGTVKDSYIVVLKDGASLQSRDSVARRYGAKVKHRYSTALRGFAATMTEADARRTAADPAVEYVEQDGIAHGLDTQLNPPSWGLDRIDQRDLPLDKSYTYPSTASNVTAYVIDSGIRTSHQDFGGRATWGVNKTGDGNDSDCVWHGTHVAGTIGGTAHGVAKGVKLIAVKVLGCDNTGQRSWIIAGIDWVTQHHASGPAVANMSLGGQGSNSSLENAVRNSINDGITYTLAAGNNSADACNFTPARTPEAITVGATTSADARASFSNYGTCLDIFAPGADIVSATNTSDTATRTANGTSMAAPHVAGAAALHLAANSSATPQQVRDALFNNATSGKLTSIGSGSPNKLLYVGSGGPGPSPSPTPTSSPTSTPTPTPCGTFSNADNVDIPDAGAAVTSFVAVANCSGNAPATLKVSVDIKHTWRGDLVIDLVAPDGSAYRLKNANINDNTANLVTTYTVNASSEVANGTWKLRVQDVFRYDTGYVDSWSLAFA
ncbi:MAG: S8 family serine peptidase [Micromonosporaceae bacterium]